MVHKRLLHPQRRRRTARPDPSTRFAAVIRGNHEIMLEELLAGPARRRRLRDENVWSLWEMNGGGW